MTAAVQMPPAAEVPRPLGVAYEVHRHRTTIRRVLDGEDDRLVVVAGPNPLRGTAALLDYARQLAEAAVPYTQQLLVVLRVLPEVPGGGGLVGGMDFPALRRFLLDAGRIGLPVATEHHHPAAAAATADLVAHAVVRSRRVPVAVLPMPAGVACDSPEDIAAAVRAAAVPADRSPGHGTPDAVAVRAAGSARPTGYSTPDAVAVRATGSARPTGYPAPDAVAVRATGSARPTGYSTPDAVAVSATGPTGTPLGHDTRAWCPRPHAVVRPSAAGVLPVRATVDRLRGTGLAGRLLVDLTPRADHERGQWAGGAEVARLLAAGHTGPAGVLVESSLHGAGARLSLPDTVALLDTLAIAVERRRMRLR
ncbi:DAHP synthetase I family protein [Saccharothrix syringae]|uniref:hypothetical protein n=1 Tax=Saccharothrix syringae TaxID=103733 RepID=UPI00068CF455|nr:hypothetical protein [Saccharothrix syringae]